MHGSIFTKIFNVRNFVLIILYTYLLGSCNTIDTGDALIIGPNVKSNLNDSTTVILAEMTQNYIELKDALIIANAHGARAASTKMAVHADNLQSAITGDTLYYPLLTVLLDSIAYYNRKISISTDNDCEKKRIDFAPLSELMIKTISISGLKNIKLYKYYSPMALNEKGAVWLSQNQLKQNPYFGKKMLESGEIVSTFN